MHQNRPPGGGLEDLLALQFQDQLAEQDEQTQGLLKAIVDVVDAFGRLLGDGPVAEGAVYRENIRLIDKELKKAVLEHGVELIGVLGESAEPDTHLVSEVRTGTGRPDEEVVEVLQQGYRFRGRVLRPATVTVAAPEPKNRTEEQR
ncbi:nucleotide exchange factor GrpE [Streptomyces beijiangensis]|uniref:Nucleotide exchange factor GrpE n=1 Tax=Streptomyces beijiangensis TaxID=163361 RepID=A0A939F5I1_9ACTN|nr:nucleotide exchange factor GrpE [Streptomyces beijiangensis]MBO0512961.1 nucleotide exchange factor GrpE [Streptomyces beijiangensis]